MDVTARLAQGRTIAADAFEDITDVEVTAVDFDGNGDLVVTFATELDEDQAAAVRRRIISETAQDEEHRTQLAAGVEGIRAARRAAVEDHDVALQLREGALAAQEAAETLAVAVAGFVPSPVYDPAQLAAIRDVIGTVLGVQGQILGALADGYAYRAAVDVNAVATDDALLWLAQMADGRR